MARANETLDSNVHSSLRHNLANHGNLPDLDDMQELVIYLTLLFIVLSWMMREIHIVFFTSEFRQQMNVVAHRPIPVDDPLTRDAVLTTSTSTTRLRTRSRSPPAALLGDVDA